MQTLREAAKWMLRIVMRERQIKSFRNVWLRVPVWRRNPTVLHAATTEHTSAEFASVTTVTMATVASATKPAWMPRRITMLAACTSLPMSSVLKSFFVLLAIYSCFTTSYFCWTCYFFRIYSRIPQKWTFVIYCSINFCRLDAIFIAKLLHLHKP